MTVGDVPAFYASCLDSVARYAARIGADHVVQTEPILRIAPERSARSGNALRLGYLPIYEKEVALSYLDRYEQILVLDADVWVRPEGRRLALESGRRRVLEHGRDADRPAAGAVPARPGAG